MIKFKKGDRVWLKDISISDKCNGFKLGDVGTVDENDSTIPFVIFDNKPFKWSMREDQLELIEDESLQLLRDALKVLNMVPNKVYNGTDFESYQLAGRIQDYLEGKDV